MCAWVCLSLSRLFESCLGGSFLEVEYPELLAVYTDRVQEVGPSSLQKDPGRTRDVWFRSSSESWYDQPDSWLPGLVEEVLLGIPLLFLCLLDTFKLRRSDQSWLLGSQPTG